MFRHVEQTCAQRIRFPRIRGDVPDGPNAIPSSTMFSPHTRGCSGGNVHGDVTGYVFPAYAGMFRTILRPPCLPKRFPRIRGDVPITAPRWEGI